MNTDMMCVMLSYMYVCICHVCKCLYKETSPCNNNDCDIISMTYCVHCIFS